MKKLIIYLNIISIILSLTMQGCHTKKNIIQTKKIIYMQSKKNTHQIKSMINSLHSFYYFKVKPTLKKFINLPSSIMNKLCQKEPLFKKNSNLTILIDK